MNSSDPGSKNKPEQALPSGAVLHAQFNGILEGFAGDWSPLEDTVARINATKIAEVDLERDGGRFSLLFENTPIPGALVTPEAQQQLLELLATLIAATPAPEAVESTVACKVVHEDGVVETILAVEGGELRPLSRIRDRQTHDALPLEQSKQFASPLQQLGARKGALVALLLLAGFGLMAWQNGYVGKILSRPADELVNDLDHFERLLEVTVAKDWGKYKVTITRGPSYPESPADAERLRVDRKATSELAALDIVAKGDHLYVQLRNDTGKIITSAKAELRPLLDDKEGQVIVRINGHINGHTLRLALDRGKAGKD